MSVFWKFFFLRLMVVLAGAAWLTGCKGINSLKGDGEYVVTAKETQLFRFGPAQTSGADATLKEGQRVTMLRHEYGYSRVMAENGETGFVSNDALAPAPPREKAAAFASANPFQDVPPLPSRGGGRPGVSSANRAVVQEGGLFGGTDLPPLPEVGDVAAQKPDPKGQKPKPRFRVNVPAAEEPPGGALPAKE